jgi:hypothetical protein
MIKVNKGRTGNTARRLMLYGVHGVGKSYFASHAPDALFLDFEDGLADLDCQKTDHLKTMADVWTTLNSLATGEQKFKWIVSDTLDHLQTLIWADVAEKAGKASIADIGYGAGYKQAHTVFAAIQGFFDYYRTAFNTGIITLAHTEIKRFDDPESDSYDRYQPALHQQSSQLWQEWSDEVFFASYRTYVRKEEQGFNKERNVAVGQGERYLRTRETAAIHAKNRLSMEAEIPMQWDAYSIYFDPEVQAAYHAGIAAQQAPAIAVPAEVPTLANA